MLLIFSFRLKKEISIKIASLNVRCLRDWDKAVRRLRDLLSFDVNVAAIQETHFATLMLMCCLAALSSIQYAETDWPKVFLCWLSVPCAVKNASFRIVVVIGPPTESSAFFHHLGPFMVDSIYLDRILLRMA